MLLFKAYQWIFMALSMRPKDHNIAQKVLHLSSFIIQQLPAPATPLSLHSVL